MIDETSPHLPNPMAKREKLVENLAKYMPRTFSQASVKDLENTSMYVRVGKGEPNSTHGTVEGGGFFFVEGFDER